MPTLTGEGIMGKGPARPVISAAPWVAAKRVKERRGGSPMLFTVAWSVAVAHSQKGQG